MNPLLNRQISHLDLRKNLRICVAIYCDYYRELHSLQNAMEHQNRRCHCKLAVM